MKYGYARVSTYGQKRDGNSLEAQEQLLKQEGCTVIVLEDYTGTKADRPKLTKLLNTLQPGDTLVVAKLDKLSRSVKDGINIIDTLLEKDIKVHILNMGLMDSTPTGKLIRNIFLAFAEFERDMIVERTQAGKEIAKQDPDYKEGRPKKYTKKQLEYAKQLKLEEKKTYKQIQQLLGISKATLCRYLAETKEKN